MSRVDRSSHSNRVSVTGAEQYKSDSPSKWEVIDPPLPLRGSMTFPDIEHKKEKSKLKECEATATPAPYSPEVHQAPQSQGATYVNSSQPQCDDELAIDVAAEFERQALRSRSTATHGRSSRQRLHLGTEPHEESHETLHEVFDRSHTSAVPETPAVNEEATGSSQMQILTDAEHVTVDNENALVLHTEQTSGSNELEHNTNENIHRTDTEITNSSQARTQSSNELVRHTQGSTSERYYGQQDYFRRGAYLPPVPFDSGVQQKVVLDLMAKGLGNFTTEMADLMISKMRPEYEELARKVGKEVKEETVSELTELRDKVISTEQMLKEMREEKETAKRNMESDMDKLKKELEKTTKNHAKELEEKAEIIDKLEKENQRLQNILKEKERLYRRAGRKAKIEEQKRAQLEEEHDIKIKEMQRHLDKTKGDLLVQISRRRLQTTARERVRGQTFIGKLRSHHGMYPRQLANHANIPYDEGDPS